MNGSQKIGLSAAIALITSLVAALVFYFTAQGAILADVQENRARIKIQEKQTERILNKLDRIESILLQQRSK